MNQSHSTPALKSEREIFSAALGCPDPLERQRLLDQECGSNSALKNAVESLLAEHSAIGDFLEQPASGVSRPVIGNPLDLIGRKLGPFTLIRIIGEGGGGSVYLAEQVHPVKRMVALKILKLGLDTESVIARFEAERQTLARMEHPHIASVIEAGTTDEGRPYFVMEYVAGEPVTRYCQHHQLDLRDRITIFIRICRAIEHAHQKGVIHRDLKPSNILVREQEGQAMPKVIDFGVAKAIDPLTGSPHGFTITETIIGTPAYMSPEQAARDEDIDTRADIYSLGSILYELLTGTTPLDATSPGSRGTASLLKTVREIDPPRPSNFDPKTPKARTSPPLPDIEEDLDWITMKCLEKDRSRRFGSATELSQDLERFLQGSPITARPPTLRYRLEKLVARNRTAVALAALLLVSLISVAILSLLFGIRARKAEEKESRLRLLAENDRELALESAQIARRHQYVANINLAHQAIQEGHLSKALLLLEPWSTTASGENDLRGFEWWYLIEKCQGDEHLALPDFHAPVLSLAFSPDGNALAIGAHNHLHLWSLETQTMTSSFPREARAITFFPNGNRLLTRGEDGVAIIESSSGEILWELEGRNLSCALAPDGQSLATGAHEGVTVWQTGTWTRLQFLPQVSGSLEFSPSGRQLAIKSRNGVTLWSLEQHGKTLTLEEPPRFGFGDQAIHFSSDGSQVFLARNDSPNDLGYTMGIWETRSGKDVSIMPTTEERDLHTSIVSGGSLNRNRTKLATSSWDHSVKLWDLNHKTLLKTFLGHRSEVWSVSISPDGDLVASGSKNGEVKIWPTAQASKNDTIPGHRSPLGFSADSKHLATFDRNGLFATMEISSGRDSERYHSPANRRHSRRRSLVSIDRHLQLLAKDRGDGSVLIRNLTAGREQLLKISDHRINQLTLSPNGDSLVTITREEGLTWKDLSNRKQTVTKSDISNAQFSADGSTLVGVSQKGTAVIWDSQSRLEKTQFPLPKLSPGNRIALSRSGTLMAATQGYQDSENAILLWDTVTGQKVGTLKGHKQGIWSLAFSPDGKTLASSGGEGNIILWNLATRSELLTIRNQGSTLAGLLFSPNSRTLIARSPGFHLSPEIKLFQTSTKRR